MTTMRTRKRHIVRQQGQAMLEALLLLPLMAVMVRRSACRGSKSVEASTISSPTCH